MILQFVHLNIKMSKQLGGSFTFFPQSEKQWFLMLITPDMDPTITNLLEEAHIELNKMINLIFLSGSIQNIRHSQFDEGERWI